MSDADVVVIAAKRIVATAGILIRQVREIGNRHNIGKGLVVAGDQGSGVTLRCGRGPGNWSCG